MLRARVITGVLLALGLLAALYLLPTPYFALLFASLVLLAGYEWARISGCVGRTQRILFVLALGACIALLGHDAALRFWALPLAIGVWLLAILRVLRFRERRSGAGRILLNLLMGLIVLSAAWVALVRLHELPQGANYILLGFLLVWCADIGAYFAGKRFGARRLAPRVSPGKTWEGAIGGLLLTWTVLGGIAWGIGLRGDALLWILAVIVPVLFILSVFGDLFESVLKRQSGHKDSGALLPGHGGLLDRIDSFLAVLPVFTLLVLQSVG